MKEHMPLSGSELISELYTIIVSDGKTDRLSARCHELDLDRVLTGYRRLPWVRRIVTITPSGNVMVWEN